MTQELPRLESTEHIRVLLDEFKFKTPISRLDVYHIFQKINTKFYIPPDIFNIVIENIITYYKYCTKNDNIRSSSRTANNYIVIRSNYNKKLKIRFKGYYLYLNTLEYIRHGLLTRKDIIDYIKTYNEITSVEDILLNKNNVSMVLR